MFRKSFVLLSNSELGGIFELFTNSIEPTAAFFSNAVTSFFSNAATLRSFRTQILRFFRTQETQANAPRCEHERRRTKGSFFSNAGAFFLLFIIARTRSRSCIERVGFRMDCHNYGTM